MKEFVDDFFAKLFLVAFILVVVWAILMLADDKFVAHLFSPWEKK